MSKLPTYLLKAPADDMARWREAAAASGQTFAAYLREALDEKTSSPQSLPKPRRRKPR